MKTKRHETPVLDHPIKIIYLDNDLVVMDKPCSLPVSNCYIRYIAVKLIFNLKCVVWLVIFSLLWLKGKKCFSIYLVFLPITPPFTHLLHITLCVLVSLICISWKVINSIKEFNFLLCLHCISHLVYEILDLWFL